MKIMNYNILELHEKYWNIKLQKVYISFISYVV